MKHCIHYSGLKFIHEKTCDKRVDIDKELNGDYFNSMRRIPCLNTNTPPDFTCEHQAFRSDEEHKEHKEKRERELRELAARMISIDPIISKLKKENPEGGCGEVKCPTCAKLLRWEISDYNGHIRMQCETKDCFSMIE